MQAMNKELIEAIVDQVNRQESVEAQVLAIREILNLVNDIQADIATALLDAQRGKSQMEVT